MKINAEIKKEIWELVSHYTINTTTANWIMSLVRDLTEEAEKEGIERGKIIERHGCESYIE